MNSDEETRSIHVAFGFSPIVVSYLTGAKSLTPMTRFSFLNRPEKSLCFARIFTEVFKHLRTTAMTKKPRS